MERLQSLLLMEIKWKPKRTDGTVKRIICGVEPLTLLVRRRWKIIMGETACATKLSIFYVKVELRKGMLYNGKTEEKIRDWDYVVEIVSFNGKKNRIVACAERM